jgi:hypothetical protein
MTSVALRWWKSLPAVAVAALLVPLSSLADTPRPRTSAFTALEEELIVTPGEEPSTERQPVLGYLHHTEEGWKLNVVPGAVVRTGPLPLATTTADSAREDFSSHAVAPYAPLLRVDF